MSRLPVPLYDEYLALECESCGRDLLKELDGIIAFVRHSADDPVQRFEAIYWACKGKCDRKMEEYYAERKLFTAWEDIKDLTNPIEFIRWNMAILNRLHGGDQYSEGAFKALKHFILWPIELAQQTC